jgi:hypothetical protein
VPSNPKYYEFSHPQWRAKHCSKKDPEFSLVVAPESFQTEGRSGKFEMRQRKADIEKLAITKIIVGDPQERIGFPRIQFGHEQKLTKKSSKLDLPPKGSASKPHL